ncbi:MAG: hypothetical protein ACLPXB_03990 [Thiobacillaceae bacterium]
MSTHPISTVCWQSIGVISLGALRPVGIIGWRSPFHAPGIGLAGLGRIRLLLAVSLPGTLGERKRFGSDGDRDGPGRGR